MGINSHEGCRIVDESDGSIIDDDEVLAEMKGSVLMLLKPTDTWTPAPSLNTSQDVDSGSRHGEFTCLRQIIDVWSV
jgi:hypothetical protein